MRPQALRMFRTNPTRLFTLFAASAALAGCAAGPDFRAPSATDLRLPPTYDALHGTQGFPAELAAWWDGFGDPLLSDLIARALAGSTDIDAAKARLRVARATAAGVRGALLPSLGASATGSDAVEVSGGRPAVDTFQVGVDASWEADLFGGGRRAAEAADASAAASEAGLFDIQRTITAEVALSYIEARSSQARLAVARANLGHQDETLQIAQWRNRAGLVSVLDVDRARSLRAQTAATIPALEQAIAAAANRIAVLAGEAPGPIARELAAPMPIPLAADRVDPGLPAELLWRRPDIRASRAALAAETARIGVAEAQLYPSLRLSGSLSSSAFTLSDLGSAIAGNILGGITAPIFQGGQIRARIAGQRAATDAALADYRGTVLRALEDVENALLALDRTKARETDLGVAADAARSAAEYARLQYRTGLIDFGSLLDAERSLLSAEDGRTSARAARASALVQFFKAIGGGWTPLDINLARQE